MGLKDNETFEFEVEISEIVDGKIVCIKKEKRVGKILSEEDDPIYQSLLKNIGIGMMNPMYIEVNEIQDTDYEYKKIIKFLNKFIEYYAKKNNDDVDNYKLEFINYGKTELVYVLNNKNGERVTILVKQPAVRFGDVYKEGQNLIELNKRDKSVVAPIDYFEFGDQELYVTPYINQARCVASYGRWGMYVPEPYYRFESFTEEQEKIVNTCMIAKLVSLYDFDKQEGISQCKLGGGDFMLPKGWENEIPTIENTLNNLYLIAARNKIKCSFDEYIEIIKSEFSRTTIKEDQSQLLINLRGRVPMKVSNIEVGINLGINLIKEEKVKCLVKSLENKIKQI